MLDRFTVSSLIKSVIVLMALCMTALLSVSAWNSQSRLAMTGRILVVTDASSNFFKALHNLRSDRSTTSRNLTDEAPLSLVCTPAVGQRSVRKHTLLRAGAGQLQQTVPGFTNFLPTQTLSWAHSS